MRRLVPIVVGVVVVTAALAVMAVLLSAANTTSWTDLGVGDCFDLAGALDDGDGEVGSVLAVDTVSCDEPHDAEVVLVGELAADGEPYPSDDELFDLVDARCATWVAPPGASGFGLLPIAPDETTWNDRSGRFACVAVWPDPVAVALVGR